MHALSDSDKGAILDAGGIPNGTWTLISFNKKQKPKKPIKKLLKANGYEITKRSGGKFEAIMEYELIE